VAQILLHPVSGCNALTITRRQSQPGRHNSTPGSRIPHLEDRAGV